MELRQPGPGVCRSGDGTDDHFCAEIVLVGHRIGVVHVVVVIHGPQQRRAFLRRQTVHRVEIGDQAVAQPQKIGYDPLRFHAVVPGLFPIKSAVAAVQAHDGRKYAELDPAHRQLVAARAQHVAADIMAPPGIAHVAGVGREVGLEGEAFPAGHGIAGKPYRIAVAAHAGIAGEGQRQPSGPPAVQKVQVIEHPERVDARHRGALALLPVNPPEIHAGFLVGVVQVLEVSLHEPPVRGLKGNLVLVGAVHAQSFRHGRIRLLVGPDAIRRMEIESHMQAHVVETAEKPLGVGKELPVPGVSRPAAAIFRRNIHQMPIHVDHRYGQRNFPGPESLHQRQIALLRISVVAAPPVAQREPGQQRRMAAEAVEVPEAGHVAVSIAEKVQVHAFVTARFDPLPGGDEGAAAVVQYGKAAPGQQAALQLRRPVGAVQRPRRTLQVLYFIPVAPAGAVGVEALLQVNGKSLGGKALPVVVQVELLRNDLQPAVLLHGAEGRRREVPADDRLGGLVREMPFRLILHADQGFRQNGETVTCSCDQCFRSGLRLHLQRVIVRHDRCSPFRNEKICGMTEIFEACVLSRRG